MTATPITFFNLKTADVDGDDEADAAGSYDAATVAGARIRTNLHWNDDGTVSTPDGTFTVLVAFRGSELEVEDVTTSDRDAALRRIAVVRSVMRTANGETSTPPAKAGAKKA